MTVAESMEHLLDESEEHLKGIGRKLNHVGNRPRFPMFALWNVAFPTDVFDERGSITVKIRDIWPQACQYIVNFAYRFQDETDESGLQFLSLPGHKLTDRSAILSALSKAQSTSNIFSSMEQWRMYNVIQTSAIASVEDFDRHYKAVSEFRRILGDNEKTMLIVLLDESRYGRAISAEVRKYLSDYSEGGKSLYASTVLIGNMTRDNHGCSQNELFRIAAAIMTLSNNATFDESEASHYYQNITSLYNGNTFVVSYQRLERPNRDISLQIYQTILDRAVDHISQLPPQDAQEWSGFLTDNVRGGQSGRIRICEETAQRWPVKINPEIFEHLPLRTKPKELPGRMGTLPFARLKRITYGGILDYLAEEYSENQIYGSERPEMVNRYADDMKEKWKQIALRRRPLWMYRDLTDRQIDDMIAELSTGRPPEDEMVLRYFEECVRIQVRKRLLYPRIKQALEELREKSREAERILRQFQDAYRQLIPPNGFRRLGLDYRNAAMDFLDGSTGQDCLQQICFAEDGVSGVLECMWDCFKKLVKEKPVLFSLSFMDEWVQRLKYEEDRIYRTISDELTGMEDNLFRLRGNYPVSDKQLRVFLLHTADMDGNHPTALYENLKKAFCQEPTPQYLNTGYDGDMEAFTFVTCEGLNLI